MSVFMIATSGIMVIVILLFNLAIRGYFANYTRTELKNTFTTLSILVEKQMKSGVSETENQESSLLDISAALIASRLTGKTEIFFFDEDFNMLFPKNAGGTLLNGTLVDHIKQYDFTDNTGEISKTRTNHDVYYITGMSFDELETGKLYIVLVSAMADRSRMIGVMTVFLIVIMLLSWAVGIVFAGRSARSISRPIQKVCGYAKEIGNGRFITVPPDQSFVEINQLISSMNEMSGRLKAADQSQKLFLQNASHELRTPLMSIQGYSEAIEKGVGHDPKEAAAIIKSESIRLTTLVEELITLSKIENNIYDKAFVQIDLGEAVTECVRRLNGLAIKEHKKITLDVKPDIIITAEESLLDKVLINVVSNCLRYAESEVAIRLDYGGGRALLTVSDDGEGFAEEDLPHIFDRFYKGKNGKFGLGLAIAMKALEIMSGSIEVYNGSTGAVFDIKLPATVIEPPEADT